MLAILLLFGTAFHTTARVNAGGYSAVGVGVTLPTFSIAIVGRRRYNYL